MTVGRLIGIGEIMEAYREFHRLRKNSATGNAFEATFEMAELTEWLQQVARSTVEKDELERRTGMPMSELVEVFESHSAAAVMVGYLIGRRQKEREQEAGLE